MPSLHHPTRSGRATLAILAIALIGLLVLAGCELSSMDIEAAGQGSNDAVGIKVGEVAPDFTLTDLDGNQVSLSDFRGKTVLINFWATWCPPCRKEMPDIESLYQQYKDLDFVVLGVDIAESADNVRRFVKQGGYSWTFVIDAGYQAAVAYQVRAIPSSFFLDEEGVVRAAHVGYMTKRAMEGYLAQTVS